MEISQGWNKHPSYSRCLIQQRSRVCSLHWQHPYHLGTCRNAHSRTPPETHWIGNSEGWAQPSWALTKPSGGSNALKDGESLVYFKDSKQLLHKLSLKMWPLTALLWDSLLATPNKSKQINTTTTKSLQSSDHRQCVVLSPNGSDPLGLHPAFLRVF